VHSEIQTTQNLKLGYKTSSKHL